MRLPSVDLDVVIEVDKRFKTGFTDDVGAIFDKVSFNGVDAVSIGRRVEDGVDIKEDSNLTIVTFPDA